MLTSSAMRNKSFVPAITGWEESPRERTPRRALTVKMNNFLEEERAAPKPNLVVGTWPFQGDKKKRSKRPRPVTATLDRPRLLDIALLGKIDMSLMRKELLSIYTLMRAPIIVKSPIRQVKRTSDESLEGDENTSPLPVKFKAKSKRASKNEAIQSIVIDVSQTRRKDTLKIPLRSSIGREKSPLKLVPAVGRNPKNRRKIDEVFSGPVIRPLAKPCDSCGRASRPERLHTHPPPPSPVTPISTKHITLKPNLSGRPRIDELPQAAGSRDRLQGRGRSPGRRVQGEIPRSARSEEPLPGVPLLCSHCGRRFGTASIAIHEGKCREKRDSSAAVARSQAHPSRLSASPSPPRRHHSPRKTNELKSKADPPDPTSTRLGLTLIVPIINSPKPAEGGVHGSSKSLQSAIPITSSPRAPSNTRVASSPRIIVEETSELDDYIFKADGNLDCEATFLRIWDTHLKSLVQCSCCGRSFAPERIERHQACCNGTSRRPGHASSPRPHPRSFRH